MSSNSSAAEAPASAPKSEDPKATEEKPAPEKKKAAASEKKPRSLADELFARQIRAAAEVPYDATRKQKIQAQQEALETVEILKARDQFESLLVVQMAATHAAAMRCLRISAHFAGDDNRNLNLAAKLMSLYVRQFEAIDKHRGKGEQKVTVKHVHVGADGRVAVSGAHRRGASGRVNPPAQQPGNANPASGGGAA